MIIEPLEARIAPASLSFIDVDGDKVVITTTGPGKLILGDNVMINNGQLELLSIFDPAF